MEEFYHLSHDHPLTFFLNDDIEDQKDYMCSICGLPILSTPSYTCTTTGCNFFLHKPCAKLPQELHNPRHHPYKPYPHTLKLTQTSDSHNFTYVCLKCTSHIDMHPLLAVPVEIKSKHRSHKSHPLVAICRETSSLCDACGQKQIGFFFSCQECDFWIHQDCAILPSILKLTSHPHPFILTYSLSYNHQVLLPQCIICEEFMSFNVGLYFCLQCSSYAHVNCVKSNMENLESGAQKGLELIQLPADEGNTFPSLVIRRYLQGNPVPDDKKLRTIEIYHKHPLDFHDRGFGSSSREACNLICDICVQPINYVSSPFYRCFDCHFLAHNICANLLPSSDIRIEGEVDIKASLLSNASEFLFNSVFPCFFCHRPCNGFCYYFDDGLLRALLDLECMFAPYSIKHASHGQHVLFRTSVESQTDLLRCCSSYSLSHDIYRCIHCDDFCIHVRCALLPKRTGHKFDEHPLELITSPWNKQDQREDNYCFCEFCEEHIDHKYWYYGCSKCKHYFHVNCIPSVGYLSKVKFGGILDNNNIHCHPLTLTRMLTVERDERCGYCRKIIKGFVDEMVFHCSDCDFWIHFSCARDSSCAADKTSTRLRVYSEVQKCTEELYRSGDFRF